MVNKLKIRGPLIILAVVFFIGFSQNVAAHDNYSEATAQKVTNGTFVVELHSDSHDAAHYDVHCNSGDQLVVSVTVSPSAGAELWAEDPLDGDLSSDWSSNKASYYITESCAMSGNYHVTFWIHNYLAGPYTATIVISGSTYTAPVPGYELITMLLVIVSVVGVLTWLVRKKTR
ncbi:MAG: hypothetical protein ACFFCS_15545 [Candidatus Hodarchaeota archaeon]